MPDLPKPKRVDFWNARKYIKEVCGLDRADDVSPAFFDALCNDEVYFMGDLHIPAGYSGPANIKKNVRLTPLFWRDWGYHAFHNGCLGDSAVSLPNQGAYSRTFYTNLTIETAVIDTWLLAASKNQRVRVTAVPEKVYKERVKKATAMGITYSRGEDREWAKAEGYSVESVQKMRTAHAPLEWKEAGRRPANNPQKESAKESAN